MKFRSDFVTNSSSSSFVLSMGKGEGFTEKQKKIILDYAEKALLGKIISVPEKKMTEDEYYEWSEKNDIYIGFKNLKKIQKLAKKGKKICVGEVSFETNVNDLRPLLMLFKS